MVDDKDGKISTKIATSERDMRMEELILNFFAIMEQGEGGHQGGEPPLQT